MPIKVLSMARFNGGIAIGDKETVTSVYNQNGLNSSWRFGYGVNVHDEPSKWSSLPGPVNVANGQFGIDTLRDEPRWFVDANPYANTVFMYGSGGRVYQENPDSSWAYLHTVPNSVGNGMCVFKNYLYCIADTTISQYGPLDASAPSWSDSWQTGLNSTNALGFAPALVFGFGFAVGHGNDVGFYGNNIDIGFSAYVAYTAGQVVSYGGQFYTNILSYTSGVTTPDQDATHWSLATIASAPFQWTSSAISLPDGIYVTSMCRIEQYLSILTTGSNSVFDNENGYIFMWDGSSPQWNFFNNIEQGSGNAIANYRNQPLSINGTQGMIYLGYDPFIKNHQLPKLPISSSVQVYPGAITSWKGKVHIGFGANSSDTNFVRGIYAWGAKVNAYPDALTLDYLVSTGNSGVTVQVTACAGMGNSMYIGWRDGDTVGIDKVTENNPPQPAARINFLVFDDGRIPQEKKADTLQVYHSALKPGESVSIYYRVNRTDGAAAFDTVPVFTHSYTVGDPKPMTTKWSPSTADIPRFNELEIGVSIGCATTTPYVYGLSMKYDDLSNELIL